MINDELNQPVPAYILDAEQKAEAAYDAMDRMINVYGGTRNKMFIDKMSRNHRTLQQSFTRLCLQWLEHMSELDEARGTDDRNKASMLISRELVSEFKRVHDGNKPSLFLPSI